MKFNDDYFVESAGKKEEESMQSEVMLGNLHNFCIFFQIGPNAQYMNKMSVPPSATTDV